MAVKSNLPRVTEVLNLLCPLEHGALSEGDLSIRAREGTLVHRLCHLVATRRAALDWSKYPESPIKEKALAFDKFLRDTAAQVIWSEKELKCDMFRGTPDLLVKFPSGKYCVVDIKPSIQLRYKVQISAYGSLVCASERLTSPLLLCLLVLTGNRYKVVYISEEEAYTHSIAFLNAVDVINWRWRRRFQKWAK